MANVKNQASFYEYVLQFLCCYRCIWPFASLRDLRVASCCFWLLVASCQLQVAAGAAVVVAGVRSGGAKNKLHVIIVAATCCTYQKKPSKQAANSRQTN